MWYAIFVATGMELEVCRLIKAHLNRIKYNRDYELLVLRKEMRDKKQKIYTVNNHVLFMGYVLIRSDEIEKIYQIIKGCKHTYRFLKTEDEFCIIEPKEIEHIQSLANEDGVICMSKAFAIGDQIVIAEGPLVNYHGKIVKIDKRKSRVRVEMRLNEKIHLIDLAVEIIERQDKNMYIILYQPMK